MQQVHNTHKRSGASDKDELKRMMEEVCVCGFLWGVWVGWCEGVYMCVCVCVCVGVWVGEKHLIQMSSNA